MAGHDASIATRWSAGSGRWGRCSTERAVRYDREASFPFENFADFRRPVCWRCACPRGTAGSARRFADYVRVSEEIGRYCGATALTFNMHNATMLWCGEVADLLDMSPTTSATRHERDPRRDVPRRGRGRRHPQPAVLRGPRARAPPPASPPGPCRSTVAGCVTGRKIFASLSGAATSTTSPVRCPARTTIRLLGVPADADGRRDRRRLGPARHARHRVAHAADERRVRAARQRVAAGRACTTRPPSGTRGCSCRCARATSASPAAVLDFDPRLPAR